jgi:hypothetical protein
MPTLLQKKASKLVENGGSLGEVMKQAGYSPNTAKTPTKLTNSKGWIELMDKYLPDDEMLAVHQRALHATKIHGSLTEPDREVEDIPTQLKAIELGYKVKRKLSEVNVNQQFNFGKVLGDERKEFGI